MSTTNLSQLHSDAVAISASVLSDVISVINETSSPFIYIVLISMVILGSSILVHNSEPIAAAVDLTLVDHRLPEVQPGGRINIDLRFVQIPINTQFRDHANDQTIYLSRTSNFFYNANDPSGASIANMPGSSTAIRSPASVMINGVLTRGFCVSNNRAGSVYPDSRVLRINNAWLVQGLSNGNVTTLSLPLIPNRLGYEILSSNPRVDSYNVMSINTILSN